MTVVQQPDTDYDALADKVRFSFSPLNAVRDSLRAELVDAGWIHSFADRDVDTDPVVASLAAVDGAKVRERLYLQDILAAAGAAANGRVSPAFPLPPIVRWEDLITRNASSDKALSAAMAAIEVFILNEAGHDLRILDGNFVTPFLGLRDGLLCKDPDSFRIVAAIFDSGWAPLDALEVLYRGDESRPVVAVTKADTGRSYVKAIAADPSFTFGEDSFAGINDRILAAHILNPGEYLSPVPLPYHDLTVTGAPETGGSRHRRMLADANRVAGILTSRMMSGVAHTLFFKPHRSGHAVIKMDYLTSAPDVNPALTYVEAVNQDCRMPHALEPYAQWKVDAVVKQQVSEAPERMRRGVMSRFDDAEKAAYGPYLIRKHRT